MRLWDALLDLLYPARCVFCGAWIPHPGLCPHCAEFAPQTEEGEIVRDLGGGLRCAAPFWYTGEVREGLLRFKFRGSRASARPLGALLAQCAAEEFSGEFDLVTWVPVSRKRRRQRGYDQAELLAKGMCRVWKVKPVRCLNKVQHNPAQSSLADAAARRANVLGVYDPFRPERFRGKRVLLIDDICTTGSTLRECARVLKTAGAAEVLALTVAKPRREGGGAMAHGGSSQEIGTNPR